MTALLEFDEVSRIYGSGETEVRALDNVSFRIDRGEFVAIMGPSGCGKSTALNVLGALDQPTSGTYRFRQEEVGKLTSEQRALIRRHFIGFVFQGYQLLKKTSALENVSLPLVYHGISRAERAARSAEALALVGLQGREHHTPGELSGGQQQRVAIARALVTNPSLLRADEPTGNLDSTRREEIHNLLIKLNDSIGVTIVMVSHEANVRQVAKRVILMRDGKLESDELGRRS